MKKPSSKKNMQKLYSVVERSTSLWSERVGTNEKGCDRDEKNFLGEETTQNIAWKEKLLQEKQKNY